MATFVHTDRLLSFTTPLGKDKLLAERFSGVEGISELFRFEIELLADKVDAIDPKDIVGKKVCLGVRADSDGTCRYFNGIVGSFEMSGGDDELNSYRAIVVPKLWLLTLNTNTRVFQDDTVIDIIKAVLQPYGISPTNNTSGTYEKLDYCTQYRETDFNFVSRLMEQFGIFYYFDHTEDDHKMVLQDLSTKLSDCAIQDTFTYAGVGAGKRGFYDFVVEELRSRSTLVTGKHTGWDYSFARYTGLLSDAGAADTKGPLGSNGYEQYDYADSAAAYLKKSDSDPNIGNLVTVFTKVRRDSSDAGTSAVDGTSNAVSMQTGYTFTLTDHPQESLNAKYLLLRVDHWAQQLPSYRTRDTESARPYSNSFTAMPFAIVYRPPLHTPKPVVHGMHVAKVMAHSGEEADLDKYGRVCVKFFWDRERKDNTVDNTWLRVAQHWAGKGWGTYFWPREGDEVLVDFMEGDPDQPIVVGSLYNGVNMPKYDPVGQYTLSGILTRSSKGGGEKNANELRFEDLTGKEQIYMNAERDYDLHVEHDWHTQVDNEQHLTVKKDQFEEVDGDSHVHVKGKQTVQVEGDREHKLGGNLKEEIGQNSNVKVGMNLNEKVGETHSLDIGMNQNNKIGMNYVVDAGMNVYIKGGMNVVVEGGLNVCLSGPGGFVSVGPEGVIIQGTMVMINSGGAAVPGSPGSPQSPEAPGTPTAPKWPGDDPPSQKKEGQSGSAGTQQALASGSASSTPAKSPAAQAAADKAQGTVQTAANQAVNQVQQAAQQAASEAQQAANQAQQAAKQAEQQAQAAVNQAVNQARQTYQQANQAVQQAQQQVSQAAGSAQAAAQQALNQAQQQANQAAQQAAQAVQQAQQEAQKVQQQAQAAASQAQQAANQAQQQAQQAVKQAQQQAQQAVNQAQQQGQQAANQVQQAAQQGAQQAQQAAQQAQQQAQQAANQAQQQVQNAAKQAQQQAQQSAQQAQQAAQQAQQQAQQAQQQVTQAASQAQQQAQQSANQAQQSANQAISQASRGF